MVSKVMMRAIRDLSCMLLLVDIALCFVLLLS